MKSQKKQFQKEAKNDKGENYYVIETREVDRNLFDVIANFYEKTICVVCYFFNVKKPIVHCKPFFPEFFLVINCIEILLVFFYLPFFFEVSE